MLLTPSFKDYLDYFDEFSPTFRAVYEITIFLGVLVVTIIYSVFLEDFETQLLIRVALIAYLINTGLNMLLVRGITFGLNVFQFVSIQTIFFDSVY